MVNLSKWFIESTPGFGIGAGGKSAGKSEDKGEEKQEELEERLLTTQEIDVYYNTDFIKTCAYLTHYVTITMGL